MMQRVGRQRGKRLSGRALLLLVASVLVLAASIVGRSLAAVPHLDEESLTIGTSVGSASTTHVFRFSIPSAITVGSVVLQYCTSPLRDLSCDAPAGLDVSAAQLDVQSGSATFAIGGTTANQITLAQNPAASASGASMVGFSGVVNPSATGPFYVRILVYPTVNATGTDNMFGVVVNSITQSVSVTTEVPPILDFCVGLTIPNGCSSATDNLIELGYLSPTKAAFGTSQMEAATNAGFGVAITAYGGTMTSGNNIIPALDHLAPNAPGTGQFGINLRQNTDPAVGQDPAGNGVIGPTANYNIPNQYLFRSGDVVAATAGTSNIRTFTVSYLVNISPSQDPGVYSTTITYVATAAF